MGYIRSYDERYDFGRISVTTESQPDGNGQMFKIEKRTTIHTAFVSLNDVWQHHIGAINSNTEALYLCSSGFSV